LLSSTDGASATTAVPHTSRCDINVAGPDHTRPRVPSATATPKSPASTGAPNTFNIRRGCSARAAPLGLLRSGRGADPYDRDTDRGDRQGGIVHDDEHGRRQDRHQTQSQRRPTTISLVRFEPGRNSDPTLERRRHP
jgi:hypothetical protein